MAPVSLLVAPVAFLTGAKAMAPASLLAAPVLALGLRLVRSGAAHVAVRTVTPKKKFCKFEESYNERDNIASMSRA